MIKLRFPLVAKNSLTILTIFILQLSALNTVRADGFCIKLKNGKLTTKTTSSNKCASGQAFIPSISGPKGDPGPAGSTRAYGFVSSAGTLTTAVSTSNLSSRKVATGVYCISVNGIDPSTTQPIVSADQDNGSGTFHIAQVKSLYGGTFGCTSSEWSVTTANFSAGSFTTSDIAFSLVIP